MHHEISVCLIGQNRFNMTAYNDIPIKCIRKEISGNWLTNGHLETSILKLNHPNEDEWKNDTSRPGNLDIVTKLLKPPEGMPRSLLAEEFPEKPALVLAPELAFGSPDFESLDALVKQYSQNLIFISGFGFTAGSDLTSLAMRENVEGIWHTPPNATKKYNGGWAWVKQGNTTKCYVFLKNYLEQDAEITVENVITGDYILRLDGNDIVVFPLICADLISKENNSPSNRIAESLANSSSSNTKVLVTGSLLNKKSESDHWKTSIGDLLERSKASNVRLLLSNCINPVPVQDEEIDKWRCLSGAYQHREGCKPPRNPIPYIRYVNGEKFSGLVLRNPEAGAIFGRLQWTNNASEGKQAFSECSQHIWTGSDLQHCDGICAADELHRFITRNKGQLLHSKVTSNSTAIDLSNKELDKLLALLSPTSNSPVRAVADKLFQKCLKGIQKEAPFCPDKLYSQATSLDCAITTLALIQHAIDATLLPETQKGAELDYGQILSADNEHEILVWDSSEHTARKLYDMVSENIVVEGGSARVLTIVGRGNGAGRPPPDGKIRSGRLADISNAPPLDSNTDVPIDKDICEYRDRVVYWKNQLEIDEVFSSTEPNQNLIENLKKEITMPEES